MGASVPWTRRTLDFRAADRDAEADLRGPYSVGSIPVRLGTLPLEVALIFPTPPDVVFGHAPLRIVLCQVRFPPIYALLGNAGVVGFQEGLRREYPVMNRTDGTQLALGAGTLQAAQKAPVWRMADEDERWAVSSVDNVVLETPSYTNFDAFSDRFETILDVLDRTIHPAQSSRIGLRKVNELTHPEVLNPHDWLGLLKPSLLGLLGSDEAPGEVTMALADSRLKDENGDELAIRHGVVPGAPATYLLDLDYYSERPFTLAPGSGLTELLHDLSDSISSFFLWCLGRSLYDHLDPSPRPARERI